MKSDRFPNLPDRRRIAVTAQVAADVVEDLALALRQVLDEVHRPSSVSRFGGVGPSVVLWPTKMFDRTHVRRVARPADGFKERSAANGLTRGATRVKPPRATIIVSPRACGGTGRRARLRAL